MYYKLHSLKPSNIFHHNKRQTCSHSNTHGCNQCIEQMYRTGQIITIIDIPDRCCKCYSRTSGMIAPIMILSGKRESPVSVLAVASSVTKTGKDIGYNPCELIFLRPNKSTCSSEPITNAKTKSSQFPPKDSKSRHFRAHRRKSVRFFVIRNIFALLKLVP